MYQLQSIYYIHIYYEDNVFMYHTYTPAYTISIFTTLVAFKGARQCQACICKFSIFNKLKLKSSIKEDNNLKICVSGGSQTILHKIYLKVK